MNSENEEVLQPKHSSDDTFSEEIVTTKNINFNRGLLPTIMLTSSNNYT